MLRIRSASGEVLVTIELASFLETLAADSDPVRALKQLLHSLCGQPRFRQRLFFLDDSVLLNENDAAVLRPGEAQLVLLNFCSASQAQVEELRSAAESGRTWVVETILQRPQDPDLGDPTPLWEASWRGHLEVVRLLLEANADKDQAIDAGTPLFVATVGGCASFARCQG